MSSLQTLLTISLVATTIAINNVAFDNEEFEKNKNKNKYYPPIGKLEPQDIIGRVCVLYINYKDY